MLPKNELALHQKVQQRLNIKYVNAKQLTEQALHEFKSNPDLVDLITDEDVVEEVVRIFNTLSKGQQNDMIMTGNEDTNGGGSNQPEPEWKRKARLAAEKREAEWQRQNGGENATSAVDGEEPLEPGMTKTVSTTTTKTTTTVSKGPATTTTTGTTTKKDGKWKNISKKDMPPEYEEAAANDKDINDDKFQKHTKEVTCCIM
jgi:hypothetical protein